MYSPQLVVELARLLAMEIDAARAYANAAAVVGPGPIRDELVVIGREHEAHAAAVREEIDAARAYANAVAVVGPGPIRDELVVIGREHEAHAAAVREEITFRGYLAPEHAASAEGIVLGGGPVTAPPSPEEVLGAIRSNEALAASLWAKLLAKGPPDGARELAERLRAEAERHRSWAERTLALRPWEGHGATP